MMAIEEPQTEERAGANLALELATVSQNNAVGNDKDYLPSKFNIPGNYNYLDPNYMPNSSS